MEAAAEWNRKTALGGTAILMAYPLSFDWTWLNWHSVRFCAGCSPFDHSRSFDVKTAFSFRARRMVTKSGRDQVPVALFGKTTHTCHVPDDAREKAVIFANHPDWDEG